MKDSGLCGPRPKSLHVRALCHGDRDILMPRNLPIGPWSLIKQDPADRHRAMTKHWHDELTKRRRLCQFANRFRYIQQIPHSEHSTPPADTLALVQTLKRICKLFDLSSSKNSANDRKSVSAYLIEKCGFASHWVCCTAPSIQLSFNSSTSPPSAPPPAPACPACA